MMKDDDLIKDAMERFEASQAASNEMRRAHRTDTAFCNLADQWDDWAKAARQAENRPWWTINRLRPMVTQVVNDIRQNRPTIYVAPSDNGADKETADVLREVIRTIVRTPEAELAVDCAAESAIVGGYGFMRVVLDYIHPDSFDMAPYIERITDPNLVYWDPDTSHQDAGDWNFGFLATHMGKREFEKRYPDREPIDWLGATEEGQRYAADWNAEDQVRIADYYIREPFKYKLLGLNDGRVVRLDALAEEARQYLAAIAPDIDSSDNNAVAAYLAATGLEIRREREGEDHKVMIYTISGEGVLNRQEWPGRSIPIIPVWGQETVIDGKRDLRGMVRDAVDAQRMLNYYRTSAAERIALATRAPWIIEDGSIPKGHERAWQTANNRNHAYLVYSKGSNKPDREPPPSIPTGDLQLAMNAAEDLQSITGFYPAALGARSNETSGRAILARQREADTGSFHFIDNTSRGLKYLGKVLLEIIPHVYSERQMIRVMGEDKAEKVYRLTRSQEGRASVPVDAEGKERLYDFTVGTYDVYVETGPNYASQREADRETMVELVRGSPELLQYGFDLVVDVLDLSNREEWKERFHMATGGRFLQQGQGQPIQAQPMQMQPPQMATPQMAQQPPPGMM